MTNRVVLRAGEMKIILDLTMQRVQIYLKGSRVMRRNYNAKQGVSKGERRYLQ